MQPRTPGLATNDLTWCARLGRLAAAPLVALELRNNAFEARGLRALLGALSGTAFGEAAIVAAIGRDECTSRSSGGGADDGGDDGDGDGGRDGGGDDDDGATAAASPAAVEEEAEGGEA